NDCVTVEESKQRDDERIVRSMWDAMDKADWIIAHNGDRFDIKMMNSRFAKYDLDLPSPYMSIDTYKEAKKSFRLPSYSLDYIAKHFGVPQKDKTEFAMWKEENLEDADNLARMSSYCDNDVKVLEDVYFNMRSYIKSHPNFGLFKVSEKACCPVCGSDYMEHVGHYQTRMNKFDSYRCGGCGSLSRSRHSHKKGEHVMRSNAR